MTRVLRVSPLWDWRAHEPPLPLTDPSECVGGHAAQVLRLTRATSSGGVPQTVLTLRAAGGPRRATLGASVEVRGVGPGGLPGTHRRNGVWLLATVVELVRMALRRERFDVVHAHASGLFEPLLAALAAKLLLRRPLVLTLHHSSQATYVPVSRRDAVVQVFTRASERAAIRAASRTLTLTSRVASRLGSQGRVEAMPDCLDVASFVSAATDAARAAVRARTGIPPGAPVVLSAGRISAEKGWRVVLRVAQELPEVRVIVCGDGPDRAEFEAAAPSNVHFLGAVAPEEVAAAMAAADVLVLPSTFEELGSVLIEAMAAGLPSVAFDVGGVSEAVVPGVTGVLVPAGDASAFVTAVREVLAGAVTAHEGPRIARERFDAAASASRLRAIYDELARR